MCYNIIKERGTEMNLENIPDWLDNLDDEEILFIKKFIMSSGSLKEIAKLYDVTYPTVRLRLDRLIIKMKLCEDQKDDAYIKMIKKLATDDEISMKAAKILISTYRKEI